MVLKKIYRKSTGRFEYALVSKTNPKKVLYYFGTSKPGKTEFLKQERRIAYFKNLKGRKNFGSFSKKRVWIRRRDQVKQRYWVGKKMKNYGSQIIRQRIRKELPILSEREILFLKKRIGFEEEILPSKHRREEIVHLLEKNPELYKEFRKTKPTILFHKGEESTSNPPVNVILISDQYSKSIPVQDPIIGFKRRGIEPNIRHELRHISNYSTNPSEYSDSPYFLQESSAKSAEYISARRHRVPEKLINFRFKEVFKK